MFGLLMALGSARAQEIGAVRFLGNYVPPSGGGYTSGCWGWTDTASGREYALLGNFYGTAVVEITDIGNIVERDFIPGPASGWRELMTWGHYAYVVSEGGGGTQIIDLSYLPDSAHLVQAYTYTSGLNSTYRAHTVHVADGMLFLNGCAQWSGGGIVIFDISDPENPVYVSDYDLNYVHDCVVRNDTIFAAAINGEGLQIIDIADPYNPLLLSTITYSGSGTHNAAVTTDGRYVLTTDEIGSTPKTLKFWDLSTAPIYPLAAEYVGSPTAVVHNVFVKGDLAIMSYYLAGMRVVNIADPENPVEVGGYDTRPGTDNFGYDGAWSVYPYFPSGRIVIGDMGLGMFVVDMNMAAPRAPGNVTAYSDYQTPSSVVLSWTDPEFTMGGDSLEGVELHVFRNGAFLASVAAGTESLVDTGLALHQQYVYAIRAIANGDSSTPILRTVFAGGAAEPALPAGFTVVDLDDGVRLAWVNPAAQSDGTPLNDLEAIEVYRDDSLIASIPAGIADTGLAALYTDTALGYHSYRIRARDSETPTHYSASSATILGFGGLLASYSEDFETGGAWILKSGTWDTTHTIAVSGTGSMTDSPDGQYPNDVDMWFLTPRFVVSPGMALSFKHIAIMPGGDFGFVEITKNRGASFVPLRGYNGFAHPEWRDSSADPGDWYSESVALTAYVGDTVAIRFRLDTDGSNTADGWYIDDVAAATTVGVDDDGPLPSGFRLHQNTPNPFNPSTAIRFDLPVRSTVRLAVYNLLGQEVRVLLEAGREPGSHTVQWDGRTGAGTEAGSGAYFYRIEAVGADGIRRSAEQRMLFIR